jgi:hypothetical protein
LKGNDQQRLDIIQEDIVDPIKRHVIVSRFQKEVDKKEDGKIPQIPFGAGSKEDRQADQETDGRRDGDDIK